MNHDLTYAARVSAMRLLRLEDDIAELEAAGCHELHFDIMDGTFVAEVSLGVDFVAAAKQMSALPCNAHLMTVRPEDHVRRAVEAGADIVTVHVEACTHAHRVLGQIRDLGASPAIAINPATPLTRIDYLLDLVDRVVIMCVDPGCAAQQIIPTSFERVGIVQENLAYRELKAVVEACGDMTVQNAARLANAGARVLALGPESIFKGQGALGDRYAAFVRDVDAKRKAL